MQKKTIKKIITSKMEAWLETIENENLRKDVKSNLLVSGGSIASMFLQEPVNDYDVYIKDINVLLRLVEYYVADRCEIFDGREKFKLVKSLEEAYDTEDESLSEIHNARAIAIRTLKEDQIKIHAGGGKRIEYTEEEDKNPKKFRLAFISPNAISLSDDLQIVCRFHGTAEEIHKTFDFIHATNYFTFEEGLVTNIKALESLITRQLSYQGSFYPLTSIIRSKKFLKRGWNIGAGEYLKIMFQISELDLYNADVLDEQLIGVDVAYFATLIEILRGRGEDAPRITSEYLNEVIDRVFGE
jgi:hypothetical protein